MQAYVKLLKLFTETFLDAGEAVVAKLEKIESQEIMGTFKKELVSALEAENFDAIEERSKALGARFVKALIVFKGDKSDDDEE